MPRKFEVKDGKLIVMEEVVQEYTPDLLQEKIMQLQARRMRLKKQNEEIINDYNNLRAEEVEYETYLSELLVSPDPEVIE